HLESSTYTLTVEPTATRVVEWDGKDDNLTWEDKLNWSTNEVPGLGDLARIAPAQSTLVRLGADTEVGALEIGAGPTGIGIQNFNLEGFSLSVAQNTTVREHGLLSGKGSDFLLSPTVDLLGGEIAGDGISIIGNV